MTVPQVPRESRPPWAAAALAGIVAITAGWWALALWPLGSTAPEWIARTREVCFGATRDSLPHAGGWILLFGEPIGMYAVLRIAFGAELRRDLAAFHRHTLGRLASAAVLVVVAVGLVAALGRVAKARAQLGGEPFTTSAALPARGSDFAPSLRLLREDGTWARLEDYRTRWVMVTFAFGHCDDICPIIVQHARDARRDTGRTEVPLLVVTLDPWRDTPDRLAHIATQWELEPGDHVLGGSVADVTAVLDAWGIPRVRDLTTGDIAHGSTIALIDPEGRLAWRLDGAPQRIREALALAR
ncbi:MAG TPA: SCO family protein [Gemmatimonadaceae bacterium]|nr:SCO family protein [Gemmatimonadaceae bacterium]